VASLEKATVVYLRPGKRAVSEGWRHSDECESTQVDVCIHVQLRPTLESLTCKHDGPEIRDTSSRIDYRSGITSQIDDSPGWLSTLARSTADEYAYQMGDNAAPSGLDRA
jgi:hypothetical protein